MIKKTNKKGFTLAELLIVVAIIAVLVAIAVPLFVGSLNKAETARNDANARAVKSAALVEILNTPKPATGKTNPVYDTSGNYYKVYMVVANLDEGGNITGDLTITGGTDATTLDNSNKDTATQGKDRVVKATGNGFTATVFITAVELNAVADNT